MKDLVSKQGEVNAIIDDGNHIIDDEALLDGEKRVVHEKMISLHDDWNKLATLTSGKQQRLVSGFALAKRADGERFLLHCYRKKDGKH